MGVLTVLEPLLAPPLSTVLLVCTCSVLMATGCHRERGRQHVLPEALAPSPQSRYTVLAGRPKSLLSVGWARGRDCLAPNQLHKEMAAALLLPISRSLALHLPGERFLPF